MYQSILEVKKLVKHYGNIRAVDGIDFSIEPGICFGLLGPNGAGKTTTIEVIEGIMPQSSGEILYKNKARGGRFREEAGIQLQNTELPMFLTVKETLVTYRNLYGRKSDLKELIDICQLNDLLEQDNRNISGGQKQRLLLAMALANDPELIFLDEPTTGLDPQARRHVWDIVSLIKSKEKTIVLTTHYMEEAQILCDRIAIMDYGKIIAMGSPNDLLDQHCKGATLGLKYDAVEGKFNDFPFKWFKIQDRIEIQTDDINACIKYLQERYIDLSSLTVRPQNLEDLFLKLTGKHLRT